MKTPISSPRQPARRYSVLRSALLLAIFAAALVVAVTFAFHDEAALFESESSFVGNIGFFLLINLNIVIVMILVFLVVKNIVKLALDRRRKILGSKLRARLVAAFVGLSLIPTVLLFSVAKGILERVLQGWFSPQIAASVDGAIQIAQLQYEYAETNLNRQISHLGQSFSRIYPLLTADFNAAGGAAVPADQTAVQKYFEQKRAEYGLFSLALFDEEDQAVAGAQMSDREAIASSGRVPDMNAPSISALHRARRGEIIVRPEQSLNAEFLRTYSAIEPESPAAKTYVLVATHWVPPALSRALSNVIDAHDDYDELRTYRRPLASSYFLTLVIVTLLVIFAAIWVGFYLARGMSVPIGLLAEATQQVAHGNLDFRIPELGDDELSVLVRSFNTMTSDLKHTTTELISGRRYMETVLAQVGVGVVSIDVEEKITTCNVAARTILGPANPALLRRVAFSEAFPSELTGAVRQLNETLEQGKEKLASLPVQVTVDGTLKHLQLTMTRLIDEAGSSLGTVLLLDDITELVSAQRMAAWRDVARRIAHEIKNPLTPIQLNAQRLQRKFGGDGSTHSTAVSKLMPVQILRESDRALIDEATAVIVKQVEILRNLVNEFSRFARMPRARMETSDLAAVVQETVTFFREAHPALLFSEICDPRLPEFPFDKEQINRVLVNLITNSVSSIQRVYADAAGSHDEAVIGRGEIAVSAHYNPGLEIVTLEVSDNGVGIPQEDKPKLFEPYYTTKRGGTGLGLAIVDSIIADHYGFIRVRDNQPRGARFIIELPVKRDALRRHG